MATAVWTPLAESELEGIVFYIAREGGRPLTAERIANEVKERSQYLANNPPLWQRHPHLPGDWLYSRYKRWVIVFRRHPDGIEILRVIDASRDFRRLFPRDG